MTPSWMDRILDAIKDDSLVILIGAGASAAPPSCLPSWPLLLEKMAVHAEGFQLPRAALIREEAGSGNLLDAAELYDASNRVPKSARAESFRELFDTKKEALPATYKVAASIPARHWVTTNFDNNLKHALTEIGSDTELVCHSALRPVLSLWNEKQFGIHLHGRAFDYDSLVYQRRHYDEIKKDACYREIVKRMFLESTVLAYGYSFSDPDILHIVQYVKDDLGGAGERTHVVLTGNPASLPGDLLRAANFEIVRYSPDNNHAECLDLLHQLKQLSRSVSKNEASAIPLVKYSEITGLVGLYSALHGKDASAYGAACASLVLKVTTDGGTWQKNEIAARLAQVAHASPASSRAMLESGLALLAQHGDVSQNGSEIEIKNRPQPSSSDLDPVVSAVCTRLQTYVSTATEHGLAEKIRTAITHVMLTQGMEVARAFANQDAPSSYSLERVVRDAVKAVKIPHGIREETQKSLIGVIGAPEPEVSRILFRLANSAYALETIFLNPLEADLGKLLHWRVYIDSNVILRTISPAVPESVGFRELFSRLSKLNTPLFLLQPFAIEIIQHSNKLAEVLQALGINSKDALISHVGSIPKRELSPILLWYLAEVERAGWRDVRRFLVDVGLGNVESLRRLLTRFGVKTEGADITRRFDTSKRETLWDALRQWRGGSKTPNARRLRRNEATQIEYQLRLREKEIRTWFLSVDGQLRQALKYIDGGKYAGFVITPTAWAHRLSELHWGEVDMAGFTEMMWCLPERTPRERLAQIATRQIVERVQDKGSISPEWLRDRIESEFTDGAIDAFVQGDPVEKAEIFEDLVAQLVPKAVDTILDEIVRERQNRRGQ